MLRSLPDSGAVRAPIHPQRRLLLQWGAAGIGACALPRAKAQSPVIRIGSTLDNSNVEKVNGSALHQGALACFSAINRAGGIGGTRIELQLLDDQFDPERAKANAQTFLADPSIVALLQPQGTRQIAAVMDAAPGMAIVGPNTGNVVLRKKNAPHTFWVRANFDQEIDRLISQAAVLGQTRIGLVHSKDPLGESLLAGFRAAMAKAKLEPSVIATTPSTASPEVAPAAKAIAAAAPQVVIIGLAGTAPAAVKALRAAGGKSTVYALSIASGALAAMGTEAQGLGFSIVVPPPTASRHAIVRRYQADMAAIGKGAELSQPSLEGYVNATVLAEGLRRASQPLNRAAVIAGLERIEALDIGGLKINFGRGNREGSQFVDVAVIGASGKILT